MESGEPLLERRQLSEGAVVVASVDGATDEFILRADRQRDGDPRRYTSSEGGFGGGWMPWGQLDSAQRPRKRSKPKTIFQLLFN